MHNETDQSIQQLVILEELRALTHRIEHAGKGFARTEPRHRKPVEQPTTARHDEDLAAV